MSIRCVKGGFYCVGTTEEALSTTESTMQSKDEKVKKVSRKESLLMKEKRNVTKEAIRLQKLAKKHESKIRNGRCDGKVSVRYELRTSSTQLRFQLQKGLHHV